MLQKKDINKIVKYWSELSDYDFETALAMQETGRFLYVGFMCHQSVEKLLKAYYSAKIKETPPHIHSLSRLAEQSELLQKMNESQLNTIDALEPLNIEARYPSYKGNLIRSLNKSKCQTLLNETKALTEWIKQQL